MNMGQEVLINSKYYPKYKENTNQSGDHMICSHKRESHMEKEGKKNRGIVLCYDAWTRQRYIYHTDHDVNPKNT